MFGSSAMWRHDSVGYGEVSKARSVAKCTENGVIHGVHNGDNDRGVQCHGESSGGLGGDVWSHNILPSESYTVWNTMYVV